MTDRDTDLVTRARTLRPLIEAEAAEAERSGTTTKKVVEAVAEHGLFWTMVPAACGGAEAPIETALGVFEELAYADGSTGWSVMANASSSAFAAIYCDDDAVATMFPAGAPGIHAGMFGPVGTRDRPRRRLRDLGRLPVRERVRTRDVVRPRGRPRRRAANRS